MAASRAAKAKPPRLARRLNGVSESATLKLNAMVQAMKARGEDVVNLTAGEPDFNVPDEAKNAVGEAVRANRSKYTPVGGVPELRELIAAKTNRQHPALARERPWRGAEVVVTNGGKQALFNALQALVDPGDEVLIPSPYWLSYPEMAKLVGGKPKFIASTHESQFKITPASLKKALTARSRILFLNSPSNPTGMMYSREEFAALGEILLTKKAPRDLWVVSDEIYDRITFEKPFCSFLDAAPALRERTVTVNGLSKSAAMTGWRSGWSVAPESITQAMLTIQGQSTSGISALTQWASIAALKIPEERFAEQVSIYRRRRDLALEILRKPGKMKVVAPDGAFYLFVGVGACLKKGEDSAAFAERLLSEARVAVVPGGPFGDVKSVRLSFATDERSLEEGCRRIAGYVSG